MTNINLDALAIQEIRKERASKRRLYIARYSMWGLSIIAGLLVWQALDTAAGGGGLVFAGPIATFQRLWEVTRSGILWNDFLVTGLEFAIASVIAAVLGIFIGVVIGYFRSVGVFLEPWLAAGYSTPLIALTPLFILWLGVGIWSKVAIVTIVMVFPILINTALGVSSADPQLIDVFRSLKASNWQIITKITLRGSIPQITTGLRLAVGRGFTSVVAAELLGSSAGMGYRILVAAQTFDIPLILAYVVVLSVLGATLMMSLEALNARIGAWR
jgi:NitT/TauT family transport system permease protein